MRLAWPISSDQWTLIVPYHMPHAVHAVPGDVTRLLVIGVGIERLALIGPLQRAIGALDEGEIVVDGLGVGEGGGGGPVFGALASAVGSARLVLVEGIEGHSVGSGQHLADGSLHHLEWSIGFVRETAASRRQTRSRSKHEQE